MCGLLIVVASLIAEHGLQGKWVSVAAAHGLRQFWHMDLLTLWHVGYYWTRDQTHVSCIGRQIFFTTQGSPQPHVLGQILITCDNAF